MPSQWMYLLCWTRKSVVQILEREGTAKILQRIEKLFGPTRNFFEFFNTTFGRITALYHSS